MGVTPETHNQAQRFPRGELVGILTCLKHRDGERRFHSNSQKPVFFRQSWLSAGADHCPVTVSVSHPGAWALTQHTGGPRCGTLNPHSNSDWQQLLPLF